MVAPPVESAHSGLEGREAVGGGREWKGYCPCRQGGRSLNVEQRISYTQTGGLYLHGHSHTSSPRAL